MTILNVRHTTVYRCCSGRQPVRNRDNGRHDGERRGSHLRFCWKGGEELSERRPLVGSSEIFSLNAMSASHVGC
jgi:hypothetical protein